MRQFASRHGADEVSFRLGYRVLLSFLPLLPAWWLVRAGVAIALKVPDLRVIGLGFAGAILLLLTPRYLRDLWRPNHAATRAEKADRLAENRLELELRRALQPRENWPPPPPRRW